MAEKIKKYRIPIIIAFIHWFLTVIFQLDRKVFTYESETGYLLVIKAAYLCLLLGAYCFSFFVIERYKKGDETIRRGVTVFFVYMLLMAVLLVALWPGTWSWDDAGIFLCVLSYDDFVPWHHFFSGFYHALLLQVIPHPGGIILLQCVLASVCVAFCTVRIEKAFGLSLKNRVMDIIVKIIPFLMPPVLMYQFSGYRMGIYIYLELTLIVMLICGKKEDVRWTPSYIGLLCFLGIVVTCWRSEAMIYMLFLPLLIVLLPRKTMGKLGKIVACATIVLGSIFVNLIQDRLLGTNDYKTAALMGPYSAVIKAADSDRDAKELQAIGEVVRTDLVLSNPEMTGEDLFWAAHAYYNDCSNEALNGSIKALVRLSLKYPGAVLGERFNTFIVSSGTLGNMFRINWQTEILYDGDLSSPYDDEFIDRGYLAPFKRIRRLAVNTLSLKNNKTGKVMTGLRCVFWNALIPIAVLIAGTVWSIVKKKWYLACVFASVMGRLAIVFLTEPTGWIMYLLSFYLEGYVLCIYGLLHLIGKKEQK